MSHTNVCRVINIAVLLKPTCLGLIFISAIQLSLHMVMNVLRKVRITVFYVP